MEEVGTVPTSWIESEYIRWQKIPDEKWKSFPLVKVKLSSGNIFFLYE